jgi:6-pyruvoyltetrahydropterin/6-carboxytetrahydropterin synthase
MVCDFSDIKEHVEAYINEHLDHNFIVHKNDPIISALKMQNERFLAIDEHPTAEVLSKMIYKHLKQKGLNIQKVVLWETASANASYQENHT